MAIPANSLYNYHMDERKLQLGRRLLTITTFAYIYIPIELFLFTWVKWYLALAVSAVTLPAVCKMAVCYLRDEEEKREKQVTVTGPMLAAVIAVILVFCYYMGYTGDAPQPADWNKHNAMLHDLVSRRWPVYYETHERSMLTYYLAQYLIPALAGKVFRTFYATLAVQYLWNALGILLIVLNLFRIVRADRWKKQAAVLFVFFFYNGMLLLAQAVLSALFRISIGQQYDYLHFLNINGYFLQFRSNLVSMRWVYPQCIVPWLVTLLLYEHRHRIEHAAALLIPVMLFGILPFVGLVVLAFAYIVRELLAARGNRNVLKRLFSPWNVLTALFLGGVLFAYFSGNIFSEKPEEIGFYGVFYEGKNIWVYLIFCLCMYGVYAACMYKRMRRSAMFWITVGTLTVIPLFRMGSWNDFCMGVSIPAQFLMMVFVLQYLLERTEHAGDGIRKGILIMSLCVGAVYPAGELYQVIAEDRPFVLQMQDMDQSMQPYADRSRNDIGYDMQYNYYTYDVDQSIFLKYFARKKHY